MMAILRGSMLGVALASLGHRGGQPGPAGPEAGTIALLDGKSGPTAIVARWELGPSGLQLRWQLSDTTRPDGAVRADGAAMVALLSHSVTSSTRLSGMA